MRKSILALTIATLAIGGAALAAPARSPEKGPEKGEAELAKLLEGRVAGKPTSCIFAAADDRLRTIDRTALVYNAGKTIYVARPADPRSLDTNDTLIIKRTSGSQLCKQDVVQTVDRTTGFLTSVVFLSDFVPYSKN